MSEELRISPVLSYQVDGGDQESHQLSSQVEPAASKGREGQSHRLKQGRAGSAVNINKRGRWKQESLELIKNQEAHFHLVWKVGARELQTGITSIPSGMEEGQVCSS